MATSIIPKTYDQWHHCITVLCAQPLTQPYIDMRIQALNDPQDYMTRKFVDLYGDHQRIKTLQWFEQAKSKLQNQ